MPSDPHLMAEAIKPGVLDGLLVLCIYLLPWLVILAVLAWIADKFSDIS